MLYPELLQCESVKYMINMRVSFDLFLPTKNWHLPSPSTRIKSWATAATDTSWKFRARIRMRHSAPGKTGRTGLLLGLFRRFCEPKSYLSSYLEERENHSWWHLLLVTSSEPPPRCVPGYTDPPPRNLEVMILPPPRPLRGRLPAYSPHFAPNKP